MTRNEARGMNLRLSVCAILLGLVALIAPGAKANDIPFYLAHLNANNANNNPTGAMARTFERTLKRLTKGEMRAETYPEGQLGGESQVIDLVSRGVIQSAITSVAGISLRYPLIGVLNYPFRFRDLKDVYEVFDGPFGQFLSADIKRKTGLVVLGFGDTGGLFVLTNSKKHIRTPDDMAAMRIRTMGLKSHINFIRGLGGAPVPIAWSELFTSIQNGTIDGQMNPASIVVAEKLHKVQKYLRVRPESSCV
jgi:TRAP-type C4-dicarboxylate transport system substrate-binding protein